MDEIEAGANLIRELSGLFPIKVAFWLRRDEDDELQLYVASDQINFINRGDFYEKLHEIMRTRRSLFLNLAQVRLVPGDDPFAVAAAEMNQRYPDELGSRLGSQPFGGSFIADGYVYPSPISERFPRFV